MEAYLGELAAIATSLSYAVSSIWFTNAGRRIGSRVVNRIRLVFAVIFMGLMHWFSFGTLLPVDAAPDRWFWLGLSGAVGFVITDLLLFQAYVLLGPRITLLLMSLAPVVAILQAWIFLGETLSEWKIFAIVITIAGIGWVVMEGNEQSENDRNYGRGILIGLGAAVGQATGFVLSKGGLYGEFSPISANMIRLISAVILMWGLTFIQREAKETIRRSQKDIKSTMLVMSGAFTAPILGVSFLLYSLQRIEVGIAITLASLSPVLILPISYFVLKERFGWGAIAGTLLAMGGVAMLFLQ